MSNDPTRGAPDPGEAALWPGGARAVPTVAPAPRPDSLSAKRIAFLWDYMFRGEEIFPQIENALTRAYPEATFVDPGAFGSIFGGDEHAVLAALPERLRALEVDAVIAGVGC